jgi:hypothetical protein
MRTKKIKKLTQKQLIEAIATATNSLSKTSAYHYNMLISLQQQIVCLEAKIKILEEMIKRR